MPLAESRGGASGGVWGNAPTTGRATIPKEAASKGCRQRSVPASNFALPQDRPNLLYQPLAHCRAKWARPRSWSCRHSMTFPQAGISPLRRRQGAMETDEVRDRPLGNLRCTLPYLTFIGSRQIFGIRTSKSTHKSAFSGVSPPFIIERRSFDEKAF